jgi:hypothetical protein
MWWKKIAQRAQARLQFSGTRPTDREGAVTVCYAMVLPLQYTCILDVLFQYILNIPVIILHKIPILLERNHFIFIKTRKLFLKNMPYSIVQAGKYQIFIK